MIGKLRRKFMWMSTLVLILVAAAVVGILYGIGAYTIRSQTYVLMEELLENDGELPGQWDFDPEVRRYLALNKESIYELRYYTASAQEGEIRLEEMHIAISEADAETIAVSVYESGSGRGSISASGGRILEYMSRTTEDGETTLLILDCTSRYALIRMVTLYLSIIWLTVIALYVIIMWKYSGKLVKPFIENDEKQKSFITNASHELKTPLAIISSNTEMLETLGGQTKWTDSTRRQVEKMQQLIENLVVLTRLEEMPELTLTRTDLSALTLETAESFRGVIEGSGRRLVTRIPENVQGMTEKRSFQQLISILMDNAAKYCDEGGEIRVTLSVPGRGKEARITVSNTYAEGKNVDCSRFFERFYREDASRNSATAGFGIGLAMGREIAQRLGSGLEARHDGTDILFSFTTNIL